MNNEQTTKNQIGKITDLTHSLLMRESVGSATTKLNDKEIQIELSIGLVTLSPIVKFGDKAFILPWQDILKLAEIAGLFEEKAQVEND